MRRPTPDFWRGKRVFLTGHTGFKGGWMVLKLKSLGAEVFGYALAPASGDSFFDLCGVKNAVSGVFADIRDAGALASALAAARPDVVIHMAAQSLVRQGYAEPVETFSVNLMGTVHLLQALRSLDRLPATLIVTTDKVYENLETGRAFQETDPLGARDPYAASKGACELAVQSYFESYFKGCDGRIASARAGNVIGGGDFAADRLVPDLIAAFGAGEEAVLRAPQSVRPWQHVLDPLDGYLQAIEHLVAAPGPLYRAWNFGPEPAGAVTVGEVARLAAQAWGPDARFRTVPDPSAPKEQGLLMLDPSRARLDLGWRGRLDVGAAVRWTVEWASATKAGVDMRRFSLGQIRVHAALSE